MKLSERLQQITPAITPTTGGSIEPLRQLPEALVQEIRHSQLLRALLPHSLGGLDAPLPEFLHMVAECAAIDASTAWCLAQGGVIATLSAWLPPSTAQTLWRAAETSIANGPPLSGHAQWHDDSLLVTGHWGFSSGFHHASHLTGAVRISGGVHDSEWVMVFFPKARAQLVDNWHTAGLQATGSVQFKVDNLQVPAAWVAHTMAPAQQDATITRLPTGLVFALSFASLALGVVRAALDETLTLAATKSPRYSGNLRHEPEAQRQLGLADARWRAAQALVEQTAQQAWQAALAYPSSNHEAADSRRQVATEVRVAMRTAGTHGLREASAIMRLIWDVAGTSGIYYDHPLHQRFQDLQVISQHAQARASHYAWIGRYRLGGDYEPGPLN